MIQVSKNNIITSCASIPVMYSYNIITMHRVYNNNLLDLTVIIKKWGKIKNVRKQL